MGDAKVRSPRRGGGQGTLRGQGQATGTSGRPRTAGGQGPRAPGPKDPFFGRPSSARGAVAGAGLAQQGHAPGWDARFPWQRREVAADAVGAGAGAMHTTGYGQQHSRGLQVKASLYDDSRVGRAQHERMDARQLSALHRDNPAEYAVYLATGAPDSVAVSTQEAFSQSAQRLTSGRGGSYADALARRKKGGATAEHECSGYARNLVPTGPTTVDPSMRETLSPKVVLDPVTAMHIKRRDPIEYANMCTPSSYATMYAQMMGDGGKKRYYFG
eukprot:jgi/Mesvir1/17363/Mv08673-RA.1